MTLAPESKQSALWPTYWLWIQVGVVFAASLAYGQAVSTQDSFGTSVATVALLVLLTLFFGVWTWRIMTSEPGTSSFRQLAILAIAVQAGVFAGLAIAESAERLLWVVDTRTTHLPGATVVANALGLDVHVGELVQGPLLNRVFFTHVWVGIFFRILGVNVFASSLAMLFAKLGALHFIYKLASKMFDDKVGALAALTFALAPTVLFYTSLFTKEAPIHFLVAATMYGMYGMMVEKRMRPSLLFFAALCVLALERFYLVPPFILAVLVHFSISRTVELRTRVLVAVSSLILGGLFVGLLSQTYDLSSLSSELEKARFFYNNYADVNHKYNFDIRYWWKLIKITFTPFFTSNKFDLFSDFSYILIWGSAINQAVIAFAIIGGLVAMAWRFGRHWANWFPFVCFLLLFAYLAPYSGRQRDSFYPLLSIYFAFLVVGIYRARFGFFLGKTLRPKNDY